MLVPESGTSAILVLQGYLCSNNNNNNINHHHHHHQINPFLFFLPSHNMMRTQSTPQYNSAAQTWKQCCGSRAEKMKGIELLTEVM